MDIPATSGLHHVGLAVSDLEGSAKFFTNLLGWAEVKRKDDYPAIFVSDGHIMLTLWATTQNAVPFDKRKNVGLHHLALCVKSRSALGEIHNKLVSSGTNVEFAPTKINDGPAMHMMCYDPSGLRIEFHWPGRAL